MSMISYTPIVECKYGWGRMLRLYREGLSLEGVFYGFSELERVYPTYHRVLGVSSARLELQFKRSYLIIRGIADVLLAQKIVDYITRWNTATEAMSAGALQNGYASESLQKLPAPENVSILPALHYSWEYDANDVPTTVDIIPAISVAQLNDLPLQSSYQGPPSPLNTVVGEEPWPVMLHDERTHRLRRLQAERELRVYGFDVQALSQHMYNAPLPLVLSPLNLLAGETAHYSIEASFSSESPSSPQAKRRIKDRGKLVLTNKRLIYLGSKRRMTLAYEQIARISCVPGAIALDIEQVRLRQFFEMRRPLECSFYLNRLQQEAQTMSNSRRVVNQAVRSLPVSRLPALAAEVRIPDSRPYVMQEQDTLKLAVNQLYPAPLADEDDTQKLARPAGKVV